MGLTVRREPCSRVQLALRNAFGPDASYGMLDREPPPHTASRVIGGTMLARSRQELEREFLADRHLRPQNKSHLLFHVSLSDPTSPERSDAEWATLASQCATAFGFRDAAYVVVRRRDADGERVHIIAARVDAWGRRIGQPTWHRVTVAVSELETRRLG